MEKVHEVLHVDRWYMINKVRNILGISYMTCQHILTKDLNMRWTATEFAPYLLNNNRNKTNPLCADIGNIRPRMTGNSCDFMFPEKKIQLKGQRFKDITVIQAESKAMQCWTASQNSSSIDASSGGGNESGT